jgi:hypothetical protein
MLKIVKADSDAKVGFNKTGEKEGVTYEMHHERTAQAGGVGYFRLKADLECDARTFVALMADPQSLYDMDRTIRLSERAPSSLMCCACPVIARPACPLSGLFLFCF